MQQEHECTLGLHLVSAQMQKKKKKGEKGGSRTCNSTIIFHEVYVVVLKSLTT